jgi:hypothetical protein
LAEKTQENDATWLEDKLLSFQISLPTPDSSDLDVTEQTVLAVHVRAAAATVMHDSRSSQGVKGGYSLTMNVYLPSSPVLGSSQMTLHLPLSVNFNRTAPRLVSYTAQTSSLDDVTRHWSLSASAPAA